jgi:hypothetical protein
MPNDCQMVPITKAQHVISSAELEGANLTKGV